jgi:hypothetical protein
MPPKYHESVPKAVEDLPRAGPPLSLRLGELRFLARNMILGISAAFLALKRLRAGLDFKGSMKPELLCGSSSKAMARHRDHPTTSAKTRIFKLMGVYLMGVHLMGVYLIGVHLMRIHFMGMHLIGIHLIGVCLMGVHLIGMCLMGVHLTGVHVIGIHFIGVHPIDVYFMDVYMLNLIFQIQKGFWAKLVIPNRTSAG